MRPPLFEEMGNAAIRHEIPYAMGHQLKAYQLLARDLDRLRSMVAAKISEWSDGQDDEAADQFAITLLVFKDGKIVKEIGFGYSAHGLHNAAISAKWFTEMGTYDRTAIHFTENGFAQFLNADITAALIEMAKTSDDLAPLRQWCRDYMQTRHDFLW